MDENEEIKEEQIEEQVEEQAEDRSEDRTEKRKKRKSNNANFIRDSVLTIIVLLCVWRVVGTYNDLPDTKRGVLQKVEVLSVDAVEYTGDDKRLKDVNYRVHVRYLSVFSVKEKDLYYEKDPELRVGDTLTIRADLLDTDKIYSIVKE